MDNLVLVGFSCSGKTTIGRMLARRLRLRFVDTDRQIEDQVGTTIPAIFAEQGEAGFRGLERDMVTDVCGERFQVLSTGGGTFIDPDNQRLLRQGNLVVHLRVRPETVMKRLSNSRRGRPRPLLQAEDPLGRIRELMEARRDAYAQAHVALDVDDRSTYALVEEIARRWFGWRRSVRARAAAAAQSRGGEEAVHA
jgi:shikimate kinase